MELAYGLSSEERSAFCQSWLTTSSKLINKIVMVAFLKDPDILEYSAFVPYRFSENCYFVTVVNARYSSHQPYGNLGIVIEQGHDESRVMLAPGSLVDEFAATGDLSPILKFCYRDGNQAAGSLPGIDYPVTTTVVSFFPATSDSK
jgi:hypothetical protein